MSIKTESKDLKIIKKTSQNNIFIADANKLYAFFIIILIL